MLRNLILLMFLLVAGSSQSQVSIGERLQGLPFRIQIELLEKEIQQVKSTHDRIDAELKLSEVYMSISKADSATIFTERALRASLKANDTDNIVKSIKSKGIIQELGAKNYAAAISIYTDALYLAKTGRRNQLIHELYSCILNLYFYLGDFVKAMKAASEGLKIAEGSRDQYRIAHYISVIGFINLRQNNTAAAAAYYSQYLSLSYGLHDSLLIADALNCRGEVLLAERRFQLALDYFNRSFKIYQSLYTHNRLSQTDRIPYTYYKLGFAFGEQNKLAEAIKFADLAVKYSKRVACNGYDVAQYHIYAGGLYRKLKQYAKAHDMLGYGIALAARIDHKENLRDGYYHLHQLYAETRRYDSAYHYYSLYEQFKDSISNERTKRAIEQLGSGYRLEKKDQEIELLNQQKKLHEVQFKRQLLLRNIAVAFSGLVLVVVLLILNRNYLRKKNRLQQEINYRQNEMFNLSSTIQDQERKRIAQDLHDGMGTLLSAAKLKLSNLAPGKEVPQVGDTVMLLDEAIEELRHISHNIMPAALARLGLIAALQNLFSSLSESVPLKIEFISHGIDERLPEEKEIFIYRIIFELVNNTIKHADASMLTVQLIKYPGEINIVVEDDGKGFEIREVNETGLGLSGIRSRVAYLRGSLDIDSSGGNGTTAIISIPV